MAGEVTASNKPVPVPIEARAGKITSDDHHPLDGDEAQERLRNLMRYRRQARVAQADNREQMAIDEDFYDGIQLEPEDLLTLDKRGQDPLVFNLTKNTVNWLLGTERKSRIDFSVKPRRKNDADEAKTKTKAIKYVQDMSHGEYTRSEAFADAVRAGLGWVEIGARQAEEPIYYRQENWRYMWFDHLGGNELGSWRFVLREKWTDLDVAQAMFPERAEAIELLSTGVNSLYPYIPEDPVITDNASEFDIETDVDALLGGAYDGLRERVKLCEMWYRTPASVQLMRMRDEQTPYGTRNNVIYRKGDEEHDYLVRGKYATLYDTIKMTTRVGIWAGATFLQDELTPYDHDAFPFFPIFCYRRKRDGMPYGIIRDIRDPQSDLNKRRSKALFLLSAHRVIYEKGSIDKPAQFRAEMDRADGLAEVNKGAMSSQAVHVVNEQALATAQLELARDDANFIKDISGVQQESLGKQTNAISGKAIQARDANSHTSSGVVFDNHYQSFQLQGEFITALIEQYWDGQKEFRITGDERKDEFVEINQIGPDGQPRNSMVRSRGDFIISKQDFRETFRLAMFDTMNEMVKSLAMSGGEMAKVAFNLLDLVFDMFDDAPGKDEMVARIRKLNGQEGPDEGMSPEEKAKKEKDRQARELQAQKAQQIQEKMVELELASKEAKLTLDNAKALETTVKALTERVNMFLKAMEAAGTIAVAPQIVGGADTIIEEAQNIIPGGQQPAPAAAPPGAGGM
jgi:hypothetical protein